MPSRAQHGCSLRSQREEILPNHGSCFELLIQGAAFHFINH